MLKSLVFGQYQPRSLWMQPIPAKPIPAKSAAKTDNVITTRVNSMLGVRVLVLASNECNACEEHALGAGPGLSLSMLCLSLSLQ